MGAIKITIPNTKARLATFEPKTLPKARSGCPSKAAFILTINSGADVAKETTVIPMMILGILSFNDMATAASINQSPPLMRRNNPNPIAIQSIIKQAQDTS